MPRTVPKTVAKTGRAINKKTTNRKVRFMESHSPGKDRSCGIQAAAGVDQRKLGETAARQAAAERVNRPPANIYVRKWRGDDCDAQFAYGVGTDIYFHVLWREPP